MLLARDADSAKREPQSAHRQRASDHVYDSLDSSSVKFVYGDFASQWRPSWQDVACTLNRLAGADPADQLLDTADHAAASDGCMHLDFAWLDDLLLEPATQAEDISAAPAGPAVNGEVLTAAEEASDDSGHTSQHLDLALVDGLLLEPTAESPDQQEGDADVKLPARPELEVCWWLSCNRQSLAHSIF